ncbi:hypothetical protein ABE438_09200 [Bosea sp. TWI1241]|uniref:hypothetical protein n=1 Tax=Bosea sp. TWI1241 TaxID=3148904 RepID=UPI00320B2DF7
MARFASRPVGGTLRRIALPALAATALAALTTAATAQPYGYGPYWDEPPPPYAYGYRYEEAAPPPPRAYRPRAVAPAASYGLARIERTVRRGPVLVIDGVARDGSRVRLVVDRIDGGVVDRIVLRPAPPSRTARLDPREETRPKRFKLAPPPPARPADLGVPRPAGEARAPAQEAPARPAPPATPQPPEPAARTPAAKTPAAETPTVNAPAAALPGAGMPDAKTPVERPAVGAPSPDKPRFINPQDVRTPEGLHRPPPQARGEAAIPLPDLTLPPPRIAGDKDARAPGTTDN